MRIRSKMFLLATCAMGFMAAIGTIYFISKEASSKIESERRILLGLNDSVKDLIAAINLLPSGQIEFSEARFKAKVAAADAAFDSVERFKYLPRVNASLKDAVDIIRNLRALASDDIVSLTSSFAALKATPSSISYRRGKLPSGSSIPMNTRGRSTTSRTSTSASTTSTPSRRG